MDDREQSVQSVSYTHLDVYKRQVHIVLGKALGHKLDLALLHALDGGLCQRLHLCLLHI